MQALALQKIGVIPDKFVLLNQDTESCFSTTKAYIANHYSTLSPEEVERFTNDAIEEYNLNIKGVKEVFEGFLYEADTSQGDENLKNDLSRMMALKVNSPKRPPRIILLGPPGSGRNTQAKTLSQRYGIVHVSVMHLMKDEI